MGKGVTWAAVSKSSLPLPNSRHRRLLNTLSSRIEDPTAKLWFIRHTLTSFDRKPRLARNAPFLRAVAFYFSALESMALVIRQPDHSVAPPPLTWFLYRIRHVLLALVLCGAAYATYAAGQAGYQGVLQGYDYMATGKDSFGPVVKIPVTPEMYIPIGHIGI